MDEHTETMEVTQEQVEAAWDETADQPEEPRQPETDPQAGPEEQTQQESAPSQQEEGPKADQPELFTIKNRDETRQVTREQLVAMAQKGWDYDTVRAERDQLRSYRQEADPALELVKSYAQRSNMSVPDYLDFCRKQELMAGGLSPQAAEQKLSFEKERAELDRQREELQSFRQQQDQIRQQAMQAQQARQRDIQQFYEAYPKVDPKSIPQEVWADVKAGDTLTNAYTRYENRRLQSEIQALKQNEKNKAQSPGSLGGNSGKEMDEIDRIWAEED